MVPHNPSLLHLCQQLNLPILHQPQAAPRATPLPPVCTSVLTANGGILDLSTLLVTFRRILLESDSRVRYAAKPLRAKIFSSGMSPITRTTMTPTKRDVAPIPHPVPAVSLTPADLVPRLASSARSRSHAPVVGIATSTASTRPPKPAQLRPCICFTSQETRTRQHQRPDLLPHLPHNLPMTAAPQQHTNRTLNMQCCRPETTVASWGLLIPSSRNQAAYQRQKMPCNKSTPPACLSTTKSATSKVST